MRIITIMKFVRTQRLMRIFRQVYPHINHFLKSHFYDELQMPCYVRHAIGKGCVYVRRLYRWDFA